MGPATEHLVLVVEDNERARRLVRAVLDHHGFRTIDVDSAEAGISAARLHRPSLILMDVQLGGMDGVAALRLLRADPATANIPVVALTAYAMRGDEERFLDEGFDAYIAKPIDVRCLPTTVMALIEGSP
jgi:CheY-like chemotaxis protein